jgi:hypothetical protein
MVGILFRKRCAEHKNNNGCRKTLSVAILTVRPENATARRTRITSIALKIPVRTYKEHLRQERKEGMVWGTIEAQDIPYEIDRSRPDIAARHGKSLM